MFGSTATIGAPSGKVIVADDGELVVMQVENGDPAAFSGNVQAVRGWVVSEDVGTITDAVGPGHLPGCLVER